MSDCNCPTCQALPTKHRLARLLIQWLDHDPTSRGVDRSTLAHDTLGALDGVATLYPPQWDSGVSGDQP